MTSEADFEHAAQLALAEVEAEVARVRAVVSLRDARLSAECEGCGEGIDPRRLAAVPEATRCVDCQAERES